MDGLWRRLVRLGFRLLYREMAFTYDMVSALVSGGEWRAWMRGALTVAVPQPGERVLEVAHGTGVLQLDLAAQGVEVWGVDYSPQMGQIARRKLLRCAYPIRLIRAQGQALPFVSGAFDVLVCTFPSNFVMMTGTLTEFGRVLAEGGRGAVVLHGVLLRGGWWLRLMDGLFRVTGQGGVLGEGMPTESQLSQQYERFVGFFREAGFDASVSAVPTERGYAVVIGFSHPSKEGDSGRA